MRLLRSFLIPFILFAVAFGSVEAMAAFLPAARLGDDLRIVRVDREVTDVREDSAAAGIRLASDAQDIPEQVYRVDEFGDSLGAIPREISGGEVSATHPPCGWLVRPPLQLRVSPDTRLRLPEGFPMCLLKIPIVGC